jgi:hypothetical protein
VLLVFVLADDASKVLGSADAILEDRLEEAANREREMRRRSNKRSETNHAVSPGEAQLADNCRKWARDVAFLSFKAPVVEVFDKFKKSFLQWLDQNSGMAPAAATKFALKYGKDVFKSLKDKRNNVQEDCRVFLQLPEVGEALMKALAETYGGHPLLEAGEDGIMQAVAGPPEMAAEDLSKRKALQDWSLLMRENPHFQFLYRIVGGELHYTEVENGSYLYTKWAELVGQLLTTPRSFPSFWPWYETMLRRSR